MVQLRLPAQSVLQLPCQQPIRTKHLLRPSVMPKVINCVWKTRGALNSPEYSQCRCRTAIVRILE